MPLIKRVHDRNTRDSLRHFAMIAVRSNLVSILSDTIPTGRETDGVSIQRIIFKWRHSQRGINPFEEHET